MTTDLAAITSLRYAANLSYLWPELAPYERVRAAAEAGFRHVEFNFPHVLDVDRFKRVLAAANVRLTLFDAYPGDLEAGERGLTCDPDRCREFRTSIVDALALARDLGVRHVNVLAGVVSPGVSQERARATAVENLRDACVLAESARVTLLIEAINGKDRPGYLVADVPSAASLVDEVSSPWVRLQYDTYHAAMSGGAIADFERYWPLIAHVQVADCPGRHEPGSGSGFAFDALNELARRDYEGRVGLEYVPSGSTEVGLRWLPISARSR